MYAIAYIIHSTIDYAVYTLFTSMHKRHGPWCITPCMAYSNRSHNNKGTWLLLGVWRSLVPVVTEGLVVLLAMPPTGYSPLYCQMAFSPCCARSVQRVHLVLGAWWRQLPLVAMWHFVMTTVMTPTSPVACVDWQTWQWQSGGGVGVKHGSVVFVVVALGIWQSAIVWQRYHVTLINGVAMDIDWASLRVTTSIWLCM